MIKERKPGSRPEKMRVNKRKIYENDVKYCENLWKFCEKSVKIRWKFCEKYVKILWKFCGNFIPETLKKPVEDLTILFEKLRKDKKFIQERNYYFKKCNRSN